MGSSPNLHWHSNLRKTQEYLRCRIGGNGCERDQIEAWRQFYCTHEPRVRTLVVAAGAPAATLDHVTEEVWLELVAGLATLHLPQTEDSFGFWLGRLIRGKVRQLQSASATKPSEPATNPITDALPAGQFALENMNERLLYLRIIEDQAIERVARTLRLTCEEVAARQRLLLKRILRILIRLDAVPVA